MGAEPHPRWRLDAGSRPDPAHDRHRRDGQDRPPPGIRPLGLELIATPSGSPEAPRRQVRCHLPAVLRTGHPRRAGEEGCQGGPGRCSSRSKRIGISTERRQHDRSDEVRDLLHQADRPGRNSDHDPRQVLGGPVRRAEGADRPGEGAGAGGLQQRTDTHQSESAARALTGQWIAAVVGSAVPDQHRRSCLPGGP